MILQAELEDKNKKGFTLVELLIVISIIVILAATSVPIYGNIQISSQLNENSSQIIQTLRTAKERSIAGFNNQNHGVKFEPGKHILYQGESYSLRNPDYDREIYLNDDLSFYFDLNGLGELNDINFSLSKGIPNKIGTIELSHSTKGPRNIIINEMGIVKEE